MVRLPLLQVTAPFVTLEIHGPPRSRWGTTQSSGRDHGAARLIVEATSEPVAVVWSSIEGASNPWLTGQNGPRFFEETTYRVRAKSLMPGQVPHLVHRDPLLFRDIDTYAEDGMCAGTINFRRQVGLSTLEVRVGHQALRVTVEVSPVKLDYERDYETLLFDVAATARGLALEYLRATYRSGETQEVEYATGVEWLTLIRNEIDAIERSVRYVSDHPHRVLWREVDHLRSEKIKAIDSSVRRAITRGRGKGPWTDVHGIGKVRSTVPAIVPRETLDTPEHRWLRLNLELIRDRLIDLHASVAASIDGYARSTRPVPMRLRSESEEIAGFIGVIERLLALPIFNAAQGMPPPGFASLTLLSGTGYGDAYRALTVLRLGLNVEGGAFDFSVMDVHDLYETWCFIQLVRIVASLTEHGADFSGLFQIEETGISVRLRRGERSAITCVGAGWVVAVSYNPEYTGLTGDQRPDVVLRFQSQGWPDLVVVFDAKYRLDASETYRKRFNTSGPPQDAINALHRYRDAIAVNDVRRGLQRPVVRGVALFPLAATESRGFAASDLFRALEVLGIGALPFLPGNTDFVKAWLSALLTLLPEELAEPGPPFAGLNEKHRRQAASDTTS